MRRGPRRRQAARARVSSRPPGRAPAAVRQQEEAGSDGGEGEADAVGEVTDQGPLPHPALRSRAGALELRVEHEVRALSGWRDEGAGRRDPGRTQAPVRPVQPEVLEADAAELRGE